MIFKTRFFASTALYCICTIATSAQAGQLFPPNNIGSNPNVSCPNGGVLTWNGDHVDCVNPTPGVSVSCPAGQVLTGINNGVPVCSIPQLPLRIVTAFGNLAQDAAFAACNDDEVIVSGGGTCTTFPNGTWATLISSTPVKKGQELIYGLYSPAYSAPVTTDGWYADCNGSGATGNGGEATAYAVCLQQ